MISDKLPTTTTEVIETIPKEPFNWIPIFIVLGILIGILVVIGIIAIWIKYNKEYLHTRKLRLDKNSNNATHYKVICMSFKTFHDYYSLNPDKYNLKQASATMRKDILDDEDYHDWVTTEIIFKYRDYLKYKKWIRKSTNGMHDPSCIKTTLEFLKDVEDDIQAIREREAVSVNEAQKTMQEVMGRLTDEFLDLEKEAPNE